MSTMSMTCTNATWNLAHRPYVAIAGIVEVLVGVLESLLGRSNPLAIIEHAKWL
jgi:hypothetical protein